MTIAERVRQLNAALEMNRSASPPAPAVPPYSNERMVTVSKNTASGTKLDFLLVSHFHGYVA